MTQRAGWAGMGLALAAMVGLVLPLAAQGLTERDAALQAERAARVAAGDKAYKRKQWNVAREHYQTGCDEDGYGEACFKVARMEERGEGTQRSMALAFTYYQLGCTMQYGPSCDRAGYMASGNDGIERNDEQAFEMFYLGCSFKSAESCSNFGFMHDFGRGTAQDRVKARELYLKACDMGSANGCTNQGMMLIEGLGGPADPVRGRAFLKRACDAGHKPGCEKLAAASGKAPAKPAASAAAAASAAKPALSQADYRMGLEAFDRDQFPVAYRTLRPFADQGDTTAEYAVGFMHAYGQGANRDYLEAARFLVRAARKGDKRAEELLGIIGPNIQQAQFVYMIDAEGPDMSSLSAFSYEVEVYCQFRGPNCATWRKRYQQAEDANNRRAFSEQMARAWRQSAPDARFGNDPRRGGETFAACIRRQVRTRGATAGSTLLDYDCF